jgi:hypothetical protein
MRSIACGLALSAIISTELAAQTSRAKTAAEPRKTYTAIKQSFAASYPPARPDPSGVSLTPCLTPTLQGEPILVRLADHAGDVVMMENALQTYPRDLWKKDLDQYEERVLVQIADQKRELKKADDYSGYTYEVQRQFKEALAQKLNAYGKSRKTLPEVFPGRENCFVATVGVRIVVQPTPQRVRLLQIHFYNICKEQALDPLNPAQCDRWTDYSRDGHLAGRYKVLVNWSDGQSSLRDLDVDSLRAEKGKEPRFLISR